MRLIAELCCASVRFAANHVRVPRHLDLPASRATVAIIEFYRQQLSSHSGRVCLFQPSCSERAIALLGELGFNRGIREVDRQLSRCGGSYTIYVASAGNVTLVASDGAVFSGDEISPAIRSSGEGHLDRNLVADGRGRPGARCPSHPSWCSGHRPTHFATEGVIRHASTKRSAIRGPMTHDSERRHPE
jgi:putative component of membrane protein insertase Oxa1/YidC/SpoIIIJ protein YidD